MSFYNEHWDKPYLTPSIAVTLLKKSPYHAMLSCPFYGHKNEKEVTDAMNEGGVVDGLVLGDGPAVNVIYVDGYTTKLSRELRDGAKENGRIPMKIADWLRCNDAAEKVRSDIAMTSYTATLALNNGVVKKRIFWESDGTHCSTEPDLYHDGEVYDLKRTRIVPTARNWERHVATMDYRIQVAATLEGTNADRFGWVIVEGDWPNCVVVHMASPNLVKVGKRDWNHAKAVWSNCVDCNYFPGYESGEIEPMPWQLDDEEEMTFTEES